MKEATDWTLEDLQRQWGWAYKLTEEYGGLLRLERRDTGAAIYVDTVARARSLIIIDFTTQPVPRAMS